MAELQSRWYNAFVAGLQADPSVAQIIQPTPPLDPTDAALWTRERAIPPLSLTFNTELVAAADFFDEYSAIVTALLWPSAIFERIVGTDVAQQWTQHVQQLGSGMEISEIPDLFFDWAFRNAPGVASAGSLQLREATRLNAAQELVRRFVGQDASLVDFSGGFADLLQFLQNSGQATFSFDSRNSPVDVSQTWTARH